MMTEEDKSLFLSEVNDVSPLKKGNKTSQYHQETVKKQAKATVREVKNKRRNPDSSVNMASHHNECDVPPVTSHETILYHQKGIRLQTLAKLKKGEFINQAQLDLHGYTSDEAQPVLFHFVANAHQEKLRYIRVIHGKGYNSEDKFPVIKNLVNQSLRELKAVIAFCSAPEKEGGAGAVNIFLKRNP